MRVSAAGLLAGMVHAQTASPALTSEETWQSLDQLAPQPQDDTPNITSSPSLTLKPSNLLESKPRGSAQRKSLTYLRAQSLDGRSDLDVQLEGEVEIRRGSLLIRADRIDYYQPDDRARATGQVYINRSGNRYLGSLLDMQLDAMDGYLLDPVFFFLRGNGEGRAAKLQFINDKKAVATQARFTTCKRKPGPNWMPDWFMKAEQISFDQDANLGIATHGSLVFQGVPILYAPTLRFPLNNERQSGFLPPTFSVNNLGGVEMSLPYYWNIAPNRDLTTTTTPMTQRGVFFSNEFRYLERKEPQIPFKGIARFDLMPVDNLRGTSRWGLSYQHTGLPNASYPVALNLNINQVSDNHYWQDFTTNTADPLVQRSLNNTASLGWASGRLSTTVAVSKWQTLQGTDASTAIAPSYDRLPQINVNYLRQDWGGFDWAVNSELTHFTVDRAFYCAFYPSSAYCYQPNGSRLVVNNQLSRPFITSYGYITPKLLLNARQYQYEKAYYGTFQQNTVGSDAASVVVPSYSVDTGAVFERPVSVLGLNWSQTLEPRAFYVKTAYRNQSDLPNFDSGANDYNFASVFTENTFSGQDRISDSHTLTLGATSRFINPDTGAEAARFGIAQRYRLSDQNVQLTPTTQALQSGNSDILAGASLNITPRLSLDTLVDYSDQYKRLERQSMGARYNPSSYRVINAAYRYQRESSEVVDMSWQWPLNDLWRDLGLDRQQGQGLGEGRLYSIGRFNYSLLEKRLVESMLGVEYDGGCWVSRFALQRTQLTLSTATTSLMFQLEFNDFSRLGFGNMNAARDNISRYQNLREPFRFAPSPFAQYD